MKRSSATSVAAWACAACAWAAAGSTALGQCTTSFPPVRVNTDYQPDANGGFIRVLNDCQANGSDVNCGGLKIDQCPVQLADPTILVLRRPNGPRVYYVTGTSDDHGTANFPIYWSENLIDWYFLMFAFDDRNRTGGPTCPPAEAGCDDRPPGRDGRRNLAHGPWRKDCGVMSFGGRQLSAMHAPQLYRDPRDPGMVYLQFTAVDHSNHSGDGRTQQTLFVSRIEEHHFRNNHLHRCQKFTSPIGYGYLTSGVNEASFVEGVRDGGAWLQRQVPVSGDLRQHSQHVITDDCIDPGRPPACERASGLFAYKNPETGLTSQDDAKTWMSLDGSVYFDNAERVPLSDGSGNRARPWLLYTWRTLYGNADHRGPETFAGNNISMFPLLSNSLLDASSPALLTMAYRYNTTAGMNPRVNPADTCAPPIGTLQNGRLFNGMANDGNFHLGECGSYYGVAEAPAVFRRDDVTYLVYSRNGFSAPSYSMVYRALRGPLRQLALTPPGNDGDVQERLLVSSVGRDSPGGRGMGHGELFRFDETPGNESSATRPYVIFHVSKANRPVERYVWFKELRFRAPNQLLSTETSGEEPVPEIEPVTDDGTGGPSDASVFIVPIECRADFNQDGMTGTQDIFDYLSAWFEQDIAADTSRDETVTQQDMFDFLSLWFAGCDTVPAEPPVE